MNGLLVNNVMSRTAGTTISAGSVTAAVGEVIILVAASSAASPTVPTVSGFTKATDTISAGVSSLSVWWKAGTGSPVTPTPTWGGSQATRAVQAYVFDGLNTVAPIAQAVVNGTISTYTAQTSGMFAAILATDDLWNWEPRSAKPAINNMGSVTEPDVTFRLSNTITGASTWSRRLFDAAALGWSLTGSHLVLELASGSPTEAPFPQVITEVSPTPYGTPSLSRLHWRDISNKVLAMSGGRGRTSELSDFSAGTADYDLNTSTPVSLALGALNVPDAMSYASTAMVSMGDVATYNSLRIRACVTLPDWNATYPIYINVGPSCFLAMSSGGFLGAGLSESVVPVSFNAGDTGFIEVVTVGAVGAIDGYHVFYESYDGQKWRCLGTSTDNTIGTLSLSAGATLKFSTLSTGAKVHSASVGAVDIASSSLDLVTHWLCRYDFTSRGQVELTQGCGQLAFTGTAGLSITNNPIEPGWHIRTTANTTPATSTGVFTGKVTSLSTRPRPPLTSFTQVQAVDLTEHVANAKLSKSAYQSGVLVDNPLAYWPLDKNSDTAVDLSGNGFDGIYGGIGTNTKGLVDGLDNEAFMLNASRAISPGVYEGSWSRTTGMQRVKPVNGFSVEFWIQTRQSSPTKRSANIILQGGNPYVTDHCFQVCITKQGLVFAFDAKYLDTAYSWRSLKSISDGKVHHVVCTYSGGGLPVQKIYVDGVSVALSPANFDDYELFSPDWTRDTVIGYSSDNRNGVSLNKHIPLSGTLDECAIYDYALAPWQVKIHTTLGHQGRASTSLKDIASDLLFAAGLDESYLMAHTTASSTKVYTQALYEGDVLTQLKSYGDSYSSRIHSNERGQMAVYGSDYFPTPVAAFSDIAGAALPYTVNGFDLALERDNIYNKITGTMADGPTVFATDATSIARYGERTLDIGTVRATSAAAVEEICMRYLERYKMPRSRFNAITLKPQSDPALWDAVSKAQVSRAVTVTYAGTTADYLVEGVRHTIEPREWTTTLTLSPAPIDDFWRWGQDELSVNARWA